MYYIALNLLHNISTSRVRLFREMRAAFGAAQGSAPVSQDSVLELGRRLGLADFVTNYEYVACRYASFIASENNVERLTERAAAEFGRYDAEAKYRLSEIVLTVEIFPKYLELTLNRADTIDQACEEQLLCRKWTRNKTKQRFRRKADSLEDFRGAVAGLVEIFSGRGMYKDSLEKLIERCGSRRFHTKDWAAWMNFRGCYVSETLDRYSQVYAAIFAYTHKAAEWGGKELTRPQLTELCAAAGENADAFIEQALADGMIRGLGPDRYAITGNAGTICRCCRNGYHLDRLDVVLRKEEDGHFHLLIAGNSLYSPAVQNAVGSGTRETEDHWRLYEADDIGRVLTKLEELVLSFERYEGFHYPGRLQEPG